MTRQEKRDRPRQDAVIQDNRWNIRFDGLVWHHYIGPYKLSKSFDSAHDAMAAMKPRVWQEIPDTWPIAYVEAF